MTRIWRSLACVAAGLVVVGTGALLALRRRDVDAVARLCAELEREDGGRAERFDPAMVVDLPAPVRRYFLHAIQPGTPLARAVRLEMAGEMRLGAGQNWMPFRARQVLAPPAGFVWDASIGTSLQHFAGADTYGRGRGRVTFRLWDLMPIRRATDPDISRAARGRLAIEAIWQPASLLPQRGVTWTSSDDQTAQATVVIDGEAIPITLVIGPDGWLAVCDDGALGQPDGGWPLHPDPLRRRHVRGVHIRRLYGAVPVARHLVVRDRPVVRFLSCPGSEGDLSAVRRPELRQAPVPMRERS